MIWQSSRHGYDVSVYQDRNDTAQPIDFVKMKVSGASFVILRASVGNLLDEDITTNLNNSRGVLPRGVYHYWWNSVSPEAQAATLMAALGGEKIEGRVWIDLETPNAGVYNKPRHWQAFMQALEAKGYRVGTYTGYPWWKNNALIAGEDLSYFYARPLWQAWYTSNPANVLIAGAWSRMMIWQDGTPAIGPAVGVESPTIDHNQWNDEYNFAAEWDAVEVPPTNGGTMITGTIKAGVVLNVRNAPTTGAVITTLNAGDKVYGDIDPASGWFKIQYIIRLSGTRQDFNPAAFCSASATYYTGPFVTVTPPPAPVVTVSNVTVTLAPGSKVTTTYSDGTQKVETA